MMNKSIKKHFIAGACMLICFTAALNAQSVKINTPFWLVGAPNVGFEYTISRQITLNGEAIWVPWLFKKKEEVFRAMQGSVEIRYYLNPAGYYTNDAWDGFYIGTYAMYGNFNIGLAIEEDPFENFRRRGWGVSGGVSTGYKLPFGNRWALDFNIGVGYAHLQYSKFYLGGEYASFPLETKKTKSIFGPTKFGIHLVYNIFR